MVPPTYLGPYLGGLSTAVGIHLLCTGAPGLKLSRTSLTFESNIELSGWRVLSSKQPQLLSM